MDLSTLIGSTTCEKPGITLAGVASRKRQLRLNLVAVFALIGALTMVRVAVWHIGGQQLLQYKVWGSPNTQARQILILGVNVNSSNSDGRRPLYYAVCGGDAEDVTLLLKLGADPNYASKDGETPLKKARDIDRKDLANLLIAGGAVR